MAIVDLAEANTAFAYVTHRAQRAVIIDYSRDGIPATVLKV